MLVISKNKKILKHSYWLYMLSVFFSSFLVITSKPNRIKKYILFAIPFYKEFPIFWRCISKRLSTSITFPVAHKIKPYFTDSGSILKIWPDLKIGFDASLPDRCCVQRRQVLNTINNNFCFFSSIRSVVAEGYLQPYAQKTCVWVLEFFSK